MDEKELQQQIALYYSKLQPDLQEMFSRMEWLETLKQISAKYSLSDAQMQTLGTETTLILLGIIPMEEYENQIKEELGLAKESADKLLEEIDNSILKNIKPKLSETFSQNIQELEEKQPQVEASDELDERFADLSDGIKQIIINSGYYTKLYGIAEKHKLTVPQMGTLEEVTTGVITDTIHPDEFEKRLVKNLGLPEGVVRGIANEINEQILKPIRIKMEEVYNKPQTNAYEIKPQIDKDATAPSGIKIIRPTNEVKKPEINAMELKEGDPVVDQKMNPARSATLNVAGGPVMGQKLADTYKATTVKTDHSLGKIQAGSTPKKEIPKAYPPNADPYREIPE